MGRVEYVGRYVIRCSIGTKWYIDKDKGWIPACAESAPCIGLTYSGESTPQRRPSHGEKVLGGLEEHLASWTKGCEGQKGSGEWQIATYIAALDQPCATTILRAASCEALFFAPVTSKLPVDEVKDRSGVVNGTNMHKTLADSAVRDRNADRSVPDEP